VDIRTKLVFALVAVSLGSLLALGAVAYTAAGRLLRDNSLRQLESLAETKKQDLERVFRSWQDRVNLIASRTQLRSSLSTYNLTGSSVERERIQRILEDARRAAGTVQSLTVYDIDGRAVASTAELETAGLSDLAAARLPDGELPVYEGVASDEEHGLGVGFVAPLWWEGDRVGALLVQLSASELVDVTGSFIGLGETGETLVVLPGEDESVRVLRSERPEPGGPPSTVSLERIDDPAALVMMREDAVYSEGLVDRRGQPVWAATRYLPDVDWGLIVKFDAAEEWKPIQDFRGNLIRLGLSLSAFAIVVGIFLGFLFAKPIHDLAGVANRIRDGELDARARTDRQDEIGFLARTFNQMAEELERQVTLLHEFERFFDLSLDMLCIAGTDCYFKRVNPAWERTLGWPNEALLSRPFVDFVHPEDVELTLREVDKLSRGIPTVSFENRYRCADGTYKHLLWTSFPEAETGLLYAVARDITELKQTRKRSSAAGEPDSTEPA
jgi:PAS domain S-box-containing protein